MYCPSEIIKDNKEMTYFLQENFKEPTRFTPSVRIHGNSIAVHAYEVNPADYAIASITGAGLRDGEITTSSAKITK